MKELQTWRDKVNVSNDISLDTNVKDKCSSRLWCVVFQSISS